MAEESLRNKTISGFKWGALDRFATQGLQFAMGLIMARILMPSDYGTIGMIAILVTLSQSLIDGGFSQAIIQKNTVSKKELSTVFYLNISISLALYLLLYLSAPYIAQFYAVDILTEVTRVYAVNLVIISLSIIQVASLSRNIDFKTQAIASLISVLLGGGIGIYMAWSGYGIWSIVVQSLSRNLLKATLLWIRGDWYPSFTFSFNAIRGMFDYGAKLMVAGLINSLFQNLYSVVIGKFYGATELGLFTKARQFQKLPAQHFTSVLSRVSFPVLSQLKNDNERMKDGLRRMVRFSTFLIFPVMFQLFVLAEPTIILILTEKWIDAVPFLRILALIGILYPINALYLNNIKANGEAGLILKIEIVKKMLFGIVLFVTYRYGVLFIIYGHFLMTFTGLLINSYFVYKVQQYSVGEQLKDTLPNLAIAAVMGIILLIVNQFLPGFLLKVIVSLILGAAVYFLTAVLFRFQELTILKSILKIS